MKGNGLSYCETEGSNEDYPNLVGRGAERFQVTLSDMDFKIIILAIKSEGCIPGTL